MVLPVLNWAAIQPQGDPTARGAFPAMQRGANFANQMRSAQQQRQHAALANQLLNLQVENQPQLQKAQLAQMLAQTEGTQKKTSLADLIAATQAQKAIGGSERFGGPFQLRQMLMTMTSPERAQFRAQHPQAWSQAMEQTASLVSQPSQDSGALKAIYERTLGGGGGDTLPRSPLALPQGEDSYALNPQEISRLASRGAGAAPMQQPQQQGIPGAGMQPQAQPQQPQALPFQSTPEQVEKQRLLASQTAALGNVSPSFKKQIDSAASMHRLLHGPKSKDFRKWLDQSAEYSGISGRALLAKDKLALNKPERYHSYLAARNQLIPIMQGLTTQMEGLGVQQETQRHVRGLFDAAYGSWFTNPSLARKYIDSALSTLEAVEKSRLEILPADVLKSIYKVDFDKSKDERAHVRTI